MSTEQFTMRVAEELAAASSAALAVLGDRLGLYRALAAAGAVTPTELAARTGCVERYVREWLANQAAGGWIDYEPESGRFELPADHIPVLADEDSPVFMLGSAQVTAALFRGLDRLGSAFRSGEGIDWGEHHEDLHEGAARFFHAVCEPALPAWVAELDGITRRLAGGGRIVDLGCGRGSAALALARAFPESAVVGVDAHAGSVEHAREAARRAGLDERVSFDVASVEEWRGEADLVCLLDCLHDMGDPVAAVRSAAAALRPGGAALIVEPQAGDRLEDNLHPVGRAYYATSTAFCTPCAMAQAGGWALGNQAGVSRLRDVLVRGGLADVRQVAATPFQLVLQARPLA